MLRDLDEMRRWVGIPEKRPPAPPEVSAPSGLRIEDLLKGETIELDGGACYVAETIRERDDRHGAYALQDLRAVTGSSLALITRDPELQYLDLSHAVFLDTETTGLGLG